MVKVYVPKFLSLQRILYCVLFLLFLSGVAHAATRTSTQNGNWNTSSTWQGGIVPATEDDAVIANEVTIPAGTTVEVNSLQIGSSGRLVIYGTLIIHGNLQMENNSPELITGSAASVFVYGNAILSNKLEISLSSYFIVVGNFSRTGADNQGNVTINDAHIYVMGDFDSGWTDFTLCSEGSYDGTTNTHSESCDAGGLVDFIENVDPEDLPDGIFEEVISNKAIQVNSLEASSTTICSTQTVTLTINDSNTPRTNITWYRDGEKILNNSTQSSVEVADAGDYYAVYKFGSKYYITNTVSIEEGTFTISCPPVGGSVDCINNLTVAATSVAEFESLGGTVTYNCPGSLTISHEDVVSTSAGCQVTRTYTISNGAGTEASCTQNFTITDSGQPTFKDGELADIVLVPEPEASCTGNTATIPQPDADDNCGFALEYASYSYRLGDKPSNPLIEGAGDVTATFPEGTTTITWIVTDECGNESDPGEQRVVVEFPLTPISYDGGSTIPSEGSGAKPMLTSTHTYQVDGGAAESGYTYLWEIYSDFNHDGVIEGSDIPLASGFTMSPNNSGAEVDITFTGLTADGFYIISLIKTKTSTSCTKQKLLPVIIRANTFDANLLPFGNHCQAGETDTPSKITWEITFEGNGTEPFSFDYTVNWSDETSSIDVCTGTVEDITLASADLTHTSGCSNIAEFPFAVVSKSAGSLTVKLEYTLSSITAKDFEVSISISASDRFSVLEIEPETPNNSETLEVWGVPNTSEITTN